MKGFFNTSTTRETSCIWKYCVVPVNAGIKDNIPPFRLDEAKYKRISCNIEQEQPIQLEYIVKELASVDEAKAAVQSYKKPKQVGEEFDEIEENRVEIKINIREDIIKS